MTLLTRLSWIILCLALLLAGCSYTIKKVTVCPASQIKEKIKILVVSGDEKTGAKQVRMLYRTARKEGLPSLSEIKSALIIPKVEPANNDSLRTLGSREGAALVLLQDQHKQWIVIVVKAQAENLIGFPVPTTTLVRAKEIGLFLRTFAHYFSGNTKCALDGFMMLERRMRKTGGAGDLSFWIGSTLARLNQTEKAVQRFRQTAAKDLTGGEEAKGALKLSLAQLLLPQAPYNPAISQEVLLLLEEAAHSLQRSHERYWAASQIALGKYWLMISGLTSAEGLVKAQQYFDQAHLSLGLPRDEVEWAILQALMGMTQLELGLTSKDPEEHLQRAQDHFQIARSIWRKIGAEEEVEALSHQIRILYELRHQTVR